MYTMLKHNIKEVVTVAATETLTAVKGNILLNNGTSSSGNVMTITQSMGSLNKDTWDVAKMAAILDVLAPLFAKSVYKVQGVKTYDISEQ